MTGSDPRLFAEELRVSFRDSGGQSFAVLDLPRFAPPAGAVTVVRGPSGSGKSTLLHVLAGLQTPDAGSVRFDGVDIYSLSETRRDSWRRERVGFVFQDFHLLPELSPLGNVTVAATFSRSPGSVKQRGKELLQRLGVPLGRRSVEMLSRGERQRVAIARALLFDPPLVLADEPTASLDDAAGAAVLQTMRELARAGKTVVMVSHEPKAIAEADMLVTLEHGRPVEPRKAAA